MDTPTRALILSFLLLLCVPLRLPADPAPERSAVGYWFADPSAPAITQKNLLASERFWPYRVSLTSAWQPPGRDDPLHARAAGVLIRVEERSGLARIDFGGLGVLETPVEQTDLLDSANRIRLGQQGKLAPNFVTALGPRLVDPASDELRGPDPEDVVTRPGFLCVFADPGADSFTAIARALAPLKDQRSVMTVLFPQGAVADAAIAKRLRSVDWKVPFVLARMSEGYTDSLVGEKAAFPLVLLQTNEGRALFEGPWRPEIAAELAAQLEAAFGTAAVRTDDPRPAQHKGS